MAAARPNNVSVRAYDDGAEIINEKCSFEVVYVCGRNMEEPSGRKYVANEMDIICLRKLFKNDYFTFSFKRIEHVRSFRCGFFYTVVAILVSYFKHESRLKDGTFPFSL